MLSSIPFPGREALRNADPTFDEMMIGSMIYVADAENNPDYPTPDSDS